MMKRRILSLLLVAVMVLSLLPMGASAADTPTPWAAEEVSSAISAGLVPDYLQSAYQSYTTRSAVAEMFVRLIEQCEGEPIDTILASRGVTIDPSALTDTTDHNVLACNALGIINGIGGGKFDPNSYLTTEQAICITYRALLPLWKAREQLEVMFIDVGQADAALVS